mmetsp:Transcript_28259/g.69584  ORF Transcript_28259/g.69584 Transcript_28259/m.69584 type:complete len:383 (-) Transcript_28259:385-1533(-)
MEQAAMKRLQNGVGYGAALDLGGIGSIGGLGGIGGNCGVEGMHHQPSAAAMAAYAAAAAERLGGGGGGTGGRNGGGGIPRIAGGPPSSSAAAIFFEKTMAMFGEGSGGGGAGSPHWPQSSSRPSNCNSFNAGLEILQQDHRMAMTMQAAIMQQSMMQGNPQATASQHHHGHRSDYLQKFAACYPGMFPGSPVAAAVVVQQVAQVATAAAAAAHAAATQQNNSNSALPSSSSHDPAPLVNNSASALDYLATLSCAAGHLDNSSHGGSSHPGEWAAAARGLLPPASGTTLAITPYHEVTPGTEAAAAAQPQKQKQRFPQSDSNATQGNGVRNGNGGVSDQQQRQQEEQQMPMQMQQQQQLQQQRILQSFNALNWFYNSHQYNNQ